MTARHRVVIVVGGFGGLAAAKALRRVPVDVSVVDRQVHHLFQGLLYQVATGVLSQGNVAPPLRDVLRHQRNVEVALAEVGGIDLELRTVTCRLLDRIRISFFGRSRPERTITAQQIFARQALGGGAFRG